MNFSEPKSNIAEERIIRAGITGTGTADPTRRAGAGMTITRTAVGVFKFAFAANPGTFVGMQMPAFRADTPSAVKGYSATAGVYVPPASGASGYISVSIWDAANAAVDLAALQYLDLTFLFAEQSVIA